MEGRKLSVSNEATARHEIEETLHLELIPGTEVMTDGEYLKLFPPKFEVYTLNMASSRPRSLQACGS